MIKRGDVMYADLSPAMGSEQGGCRPVLVIQNDIGNRFSPTVIVVSVTAQMDKFNKKRMPTHVYLDKEKYKKLRESVVITEQFRTIDKGRLDGEILCTLDEDDMRRVENAIDISLGMEPRHKKLLCV